MKKILLGTTAIIALSTFSAEAFAAEKIKLGLGGFMRHYVGIGNGDEVAPTALAGTARGMDVGMNTNSEVYFRGGTTLDNGMSVSVDIQREADKGNTGNDVSSMQISSDAMGSLTTGATAGAAGAYMVRSPHQANDHDWGDAAAYASVAIAAGTASTGYAGQSTADITDDGANNLTLKYGSPSFSGLSLHASYSPASNDATKDHQGRTRSTTNDEAAMGVLYEGEMGGASVSAGFGQRRDNGTAKSTNFGLNIGMAGFTVGGSYLTKSDDTSADNNARDNASKGKAYELGVAYVTGPYTVAAGYHRSESEGTIALPGKMKDTNWMLSGAYDLGAGVALVGTYERAKTDNEAVAVAGVDGTVSAIVAGIEVGF